MQVFIPDQLSPGAFDVSDLRAPRSAAQMDDGAEELVVPREGVHVYGIEQEQRGAWVARRGQRVCRHEQLQLGRCVRAQRRAATEQATHPGGAVVQQRIDIGAGSPRPQLVERLRVGDRSLVSGGNRGDQLVAEDLELLLRRDLRETARQSAGAVHAAQRHRSQDLSDETGALQIAGRGLCEYLTERHRSSGGVEGGEHPRPRGKIRAPLHRAVAADPLRELPRGTGWKKAPREANLQEGADLLRERVGDDAAVFQRIERKRGFNRVALGGRHPGEVLPGWSKTGPQARGPFEGGDRLRTTVPDERPAMEQLVAELKPAQEDFRRVLGYRAQRV